MTSSGQQKTAHSHFFIASNDTDYFKYNEKSKGIKNQL